MLNTLQISIMTFKKFLHIHYTIYRFAFYTKNTFNINVFCIKNTFNADVFSKRTPFYLQR